MKSLIRIVFYGILLIPLTPMFLFIGWLDDQPFDDTIASLKEFIS